MACLTSQDCHGRSGSPIISANSMISNPRVVRRSRRRSGGVNRRGVCLPTSGAELLEPVRADVATSPAARPGPSRRRRLERGEGGQQLGAELLQGFALVVGVDGGGVRLREPGDGGVLFLEGQRADGRLDGREEQ